MTRCWRDLQGQRQMHFHCSVDLKINCRNFTETFRGRQWSLRKNGERIGRLRHLDALLVVADTKGTFLLSGHGDVIEPDDGICAIGSGGPYALSAARALAKNTKMTAKEIAMEAMKIASEICIFTNGNFTVEEL